jgi:hypothetical protein
MPEKIIIGIVVVALIAAVFFLYLRIRENNQPLILGQQFADAMEKEERRVKRSPDAESPMPPANYTRSRGRWDLLNPSPVELDDTLRALCASFAEMSATERGAFRGAVSLEEFYTLLTFAQRSSVFALRSASPGLLRDGLTAVAMIEADRTDFRDILMALALLHHSAARLGMDVRSEFASAAKLAEPATTELIESFASRDPESQNLRDSWGYVEVGSDAEIGFARWGFADYSPQIDLLALAKRIALAVEQDSYVVDNIELATELPSIWLESSADRSHLPLLEKALGGATISSSLEEGKQPESGPQQFTVFVVELDSAESAKHLLQMSQTKEPKGYSMIGFASDKVFALLVARSVVVGTDSIETMTSLARFRDPINLALQQTKP